MFEALLKRISKSKYKDKFIIKSGLLLPSIFEVNLKAELDGLKTSLMIDITTRDAISYKEVKFKYSTLFDKETINIMTYNYETIIAKNTTLKKTL